MFLRAYSPNPLLDGLVQAYLINHQQTNLHTPLLTCPFPAAPQQTLFFYPRDPVLRFHHNTRQINYQPNSFLVGPQVSRVDITPGHDHLVIAVFFQPGGLHRLLGMPMHELFDDLLDASLLWPSAMRCLNEQLREVTNYDQMQQLVESFLIRQFRQKRIEKQPIDTAFQHMVTANGPLSLAYLADQACLSPRQFERKCRERLGLSPKTFSRIVRFSKAFRLKEKQPHLPWLDVALGCGYYDFQHMLRDFNEFAGTTPTLLLEQETQTLLRPYTSAGL
jgi:AraC-like DNA-binding protein